MTAARCAREDELLGALGRGFLDTEMAEHVAACFSCGELRLVAGALLDEKAIAMTEAPVPSAGTMWWRLQLRVRREAENRARRSLVVGQMITFTIALVLLVAVFGSDLVAGVQGLVRTVLLSTPLLIVIAAGLIVTPIAGWVALRQK